MPLAHLLQNDPIRSPAGKVIEFLEQRIKKDFGISRIKCAFEKEGLAEIGNGSREDMEGYIEDYNDFRKEEFARERKRRHKALINNASDTISPRKHTRPLLQKVEVEHGPNQMEFKIYPANSPLQAVRRMDAQTALIESYTEEGFMDSADYLNQDEKQSRQWPRQSFYKISFQPYNGKELEADGTNGLHVNISLWQNHNNLLAKSVYAKELIQHIKDNLHTLCYSDLALIAPSKAAHDRLNDYFGPGLLNDNVSSYQKTVKLSVFNKRKRLPEPSQQTEERQRLSRIEFRLPSSDARHDLSMIVALASIYEGLNDKAEFSPNLEKHNEELTDSSFHEEFLAHASYAKSRQRFEGGSRLFGLLRKLAAKDPEVTEVIDTLEKEIKRALKTNKLTQPTLHEHVEKNRC